MGQGYEYPGPGHPNMYVCTQTIEPHSGIAKAVDSGCIHCIEPRSGICRFDTFIDCSHTQKSETLRIAETQLILDGFLGKCREGVGGIE